MGGTREGGLRAKETNMLRHGMDFYTRIGASGGKASRTGGFHSPKVGADGLTGPERSRVAGAIGGKASRRNRRSTDY